MPNRTHVIKLIIYAFALLGVNVLVSFAATLAVLLLLFRDDPILAAVPALFALPAIVLQPWFLVFFFVPNGMIVAPLLTSIITIFVYGWLNSGGTLERPKRFLLEVQDAKDARRRWRVCVACSRGGGRPLHGFPGRASRNATAS